MVFKIFFFIKLYHSLLLINNYSLFHVVFSYNYVIKKNDYLFLFFIIQSSLNKILKFIFLGIKENINFFFYLNDRRKFQI